MRNKDMQHREKQLKHSIYTCERKNYDKIKKFEKCLDRNTNRKYLHDHFNRWPLCREKIKDKVSDEEGTEKGRGKICAKLTIIIVR